MHREFINFRILSFVSTVIAGCVFGQPVLANGFTYKGEIVEGEREGQWETYNGSGQLISRGHFSRGVKHGRWTSFDLDGLPTAVGDYSEGKQVGEWSFFEDGILKARGNYKNDNRHGVWEAFDAQGRLQFPFGARMARSQKPARHHVRRAIPNGLTKRVRHKIRHSLCGAH